MFELTGLSVLVTGGTKGIGFGIARVLGKAGCRVVVSGRDAAGAEHAVQRLRDEGCDVSYVLGDVSKEEVCREMVRTTVERHGGLDVLCCNAGIFPSKKLEEMTSEDVDTVMGINLKGTMLLVAAAIPYLEKSGRGRVILTSSITGPITGYPGWFVSSAWVTIPGIPPD